MQLCRRCRVCSDLIYIESCLCLVVCECALPSVDVVDLMSPDCAVSMYILALDHKPFPWSHISPTAALPRTLITTTDGYDFIKSQGLNYGPPNIFPNWNCDVGKVEEKIVTKGFLLCKSICGGCLNSVDVCTFLGYISSVALVLLLFSTMSKLIER